MKSNNRVVVAISGGGRSLANLLAAQKQGAAFQIVGVVSSSPMCAGLKIAYDHSLPIFIGDFSDSATQKKTHDLYPWLKNHAADWLALAGFLKKLPLAPGWEKKIINIHPALLPKFGGRGMYGARVHEAVIAASESESGASIHYVDAEYDRGPLIAQAKVKVADGETPMTLAAKVFKAECELYPRVLNDLILGHLPLKGGAVKVYDN